VADPKILKRGVEDNLSAPSSFIANAHNEIYATVIYGAKPYARIHFGSSERKSLARGVVPWIFVLAWPASDRVVTYRLTTV